MDFSCVLVNFPLRTEFYGSGFLLGTDPTVTETKHECTYTVQSIRKAAMAREVFSVALSKKGQEHDRPTLSQT